MALDAATLALTAAELELTLADTRIDKIFQPTRDEVVLTLRSRTGAFRLLLSARSGSARACLTEESFENPATPPGFCMLLRKYITGGKLLSVQPVPGDRILNFVFRCVNEMGDLVEITLAAELMGRYSNLVLVRDGRIIDALKRVDFEDSEVRQLLPGLPYTLPPKPDRLDFVTAPVADIIARACGYDLPAAAALGKAVSGVGPVLCREAAWRAFGAAPPDACRMTEAEKAALTAAVEAIRADWRAGGRPNAVHQPGGKAIEYSFTPLTLYQGAVVTEYPGFSALLEGYYSAKDRAERLRQKSRELHRAVNNLYERAVRKQAARREELAESGKADTLRLYGELLQANQWAVQKGMTAVTVTNYYDGQPVTIRLDPRLTANGNAQKYFKDYRKKQTAARMLAELLEQGEREIEYLRTVLYEVETADREQMLGEIRAELKSQGYLKYYKVRDKRQKPADFWRYRSDDGFLILVGRNNTQNERLTLHTARGRDWWFHTKDAPGSHTVVISEGAEVPDRTKEQAAQLAAFHSSQSGGAKVAVDYTQVRNIRKTGDLKPGMVLYEHYETAYVAPDPALAGRLILNEKDNR